MKTIFLKFVFIAVCFFMTVSCQTHAQNSLGSFQRNQSNQTGISYKPNSAEGTGIFSYGRRSKDPANYYNTKPYELIDPFTSVYQPTIINGAATPKGAIFCKFENKLWKSFDIGIRLRVETPPPTH